MTFNPNPTDDSVKSTQWSTMSESELAEQRTILITRIDTLQVYGHQLGQSIATNLSQLIESLQAGVHQIDSFIETLREKANNHSSLLKQ